MIAVMQSERRPGNIPATRHIRFRNDTGLEKVE